MSKSIVLRDHIARDLSKKFNFSLTKTKSLVDELESIIAHDLRTKSRVKVTHFGTFIIKTRASRTIKTVREQQTKIVLEQDVIKFIAAEQFKAELMGKPSDTGHEKPAQTEESVEIPVSLSDKSPIESAEKPLISQDPVAQAGEIPIKLRPTRQQIPEAPANITIQTPESPKATEEAKIIPIIKEQKPVQKQEIKAHADEELPPKAPVRLDIAEIIDKKTAPAVTRVKLETPPHKNPVADKTNKPVEKTTFSPLSIYSRIERSKVESQVRERLIKLAKNLEEQTVPPIENHQSKAVEKIFAGFVAQAQRLDVRSLDFSLVHRKPQKTDQTQLCAGKPRVCLGRIPTALLYEFVRDVADIDDFSSPQLRFVTVRKTDNIKRTVLEVHSFPTHEGASIHIKIL